MESLSATRQGDTTVNTVNRQNQEMSSGEIEANRWWASIRLATAFSIVAGLCAQLLSGRLPDTTIIVSVIVIGSMVSWFQLEHQPTAATVRHPRRHHG